MTSQFTLPPIVTQRNPTFDIHSPNELVIRTWFLPWLHLVKLPTYHRIMAPTECTAMIEYRSRKTAGPRFLEFTTTKHIYAKHVGEVELCRVTSDGNLCFTGSSAFRGQGYLHAGMTDAQALRIVTMTVLGRDPRYETGADDGIWDSIVNTVLVDAVMTE